MKRSILVFAGIAWGVLTGVLGTPQGALAFPDLEVPRMEREEGYRALGLEGTPAPFRLSRIPGDILVLQFFNPYCPTCQREAPELERVFRALGPRVRLLAVGVGVTAGEIRMFRDHFDSTYPMAPDPRFDLLTAVGDPGGSPYLVFLVREEGRWTARDEHLGFLGSDALLARVAALETDGAKTATRPPMDPTAWRPPLGLTPAQQRERAREFLTRVARHTVGVDLVRVGPDRIAVYRALESDGSPTGLYARLVSRSPVCDVCHAVHFLLAFDRNGTARGFAPIHVTKYGNETWSKEDIQKLKSRLVGRPLAGLVFERKVDAVTRATMSSSLIFDTARRTAALLPALVDQSTHTGHP